VTVWPEKIELKNLQYANTKTTWLHSFIKLPYQLPKNNPLQTAFKMGDKL